MGKAKVFIIEDEFIQKVSLPDILKKEDFDVTSGTHQDLVSKLSSNVPEIVITDVDRSEIGNEVHLIEELKGKEELKKTDVVIYTEKMDVSLEVKLRKLKLDQFYIKEEDTAAFIKSLNKFATYEGDEVVNLLEIDAKKRERASGGVQPLDASTMERDVSLPASVDQNEDQAGEVIKEFSEKIHQQLGDQDAETYYNLGISYMDMGLHEEALKEFKSALKSDQFRTEATNMVGMCQRSLKKYADAIKTFQQGAKISTDLGEKLGFRYEIGLTLEEMGRLKDAFNFFAVVYKANNTYRDVKEKLVKIKKLLATDNKQG